MPSKRNKQKIAPENNIVVTLFAEYENAEKYE